MTMMRTLLAGTALAALTGAANAQTLELVEVITSPQRTETLQAQVDAFEAENPGVTVEITSLPWGQAFEKFATMVSAGQTPDVVEMPDRWLSLYASNDKLESLEPYLESWDEAEGLNARALEFARLADDTAYTLPYGFYLRALFYNKELFEEARVDGPPETMADFREAAEKVSALDGKYGYCLRGGPGGLNGWVMFGAGEAGSDAYFDADGASTFDSEGWVKGFTMLADIYKDGLAPPDAVNWGFNEIVAGFYSGTCAMLDQDPDALIAIDERMSSDQFGVVPFPKGSSGTAFPTIGYAGWSIFSDSDEKDLAWKLVQHLSSLEANLDWNKRIGALPIYTAAEEDEFYGDPKFAGWFEALADPDVQPTVMPTYIEQFAFFADSIVPRTSQEVLLGERTPEDMAAEWATFMTEANAAD